MAGPELGVTLYTTAWGRYTKESPVEVTSWPPLPNVTSKSTGPAGWGGATHRTSQKDTYAAGASYTPNRHTVVTPGRKLLPYTDTGTLPVKGPATGEARTRMGRGR